MPQESDPTNLVLSKVEENVLFVTLNRPEKRNALGEGVVAALRAAFEDQAENPDIRLVVLTGQGTASFAAGGDLHEIAGIRDEAGARGLSSRVGAAFDAIRRFPAPVIAALNGDALGGGAELAMACDLRVMAAHARIGFLQCRLNISTAWGGAPDLMDLVGGGRALDLLTTGRLVGAGEAVAIGLATACAGEGEDLDAAVSRLLGTISAPVHVLRGYKAMARGRSDGMSRANLRELETDVFIRNWLHEDHWTAADAVMARFSKAKDKV